MNKLVFKYLHYRAMKLYSRICSKSSDFDLKLMNQIYSFINLLKNTTEVEERVYQDIENLSQEELWKKIGYLLTSSFFHRCLPSFSGMYLLFQYYNRILDYYAKPENGLYTFYYKHNKLHYRKPCDFM